MFWPKKAQLVDFSCWLGSQEKHLGIRDLPETFEGVGFLVLYSGLGDDLEWDSGNFKSILPGAFFGMVKWPPTRTSKRLRIESPVYSPVFFWWGGYVTIRHFPPKIRVHPGLCVFWPSPGSTLSFLTWGLSVTIGEKTWTSFWSASGCLKRFFFVGVKQEQDFVHYLSTSPIGGDVKYLYIMLFNHHQSLDIIVSISKNGRQYPASVQELRVGEYH